MTAEQSPQSPTNTANTATRRPAPPRGLARLWTPPRIMGLDVARGLAIIGMLAAHTLMSPPFEWGDPSTWGDIVNGRSSILFGVIAGVSIALMTRHRPTDRDGLRRERLRLLGRGVAIFLIGMVLELLGTGIAVILGIYGVLFIAVIPFLSWRRRSLLIAAGVSAVVSALVVGPLIAFLGTSGGFGQLGAAVLTNIYAPFEWLALVLVGLAIGRSAFTRPRAAAGLLALGIALAGIGYGVGALGAPIVQTELEQVYQEPEVINGPDLDTSNLTCQKYPDGTIYCAQDPTGDEAGDESSTGAGSDNAIGAWLVRGLLSSDAHSGGLAEIVGSTGVALIALGGCLLIARPARWVLAPLAAMGSMPLSAYSLQIVILAIAQPLLPVTTPEFDPGPLLWAGMTVGILIAATIWTSLLGRGPLERLMDWSARRWSAEGQLSRVDRARIDA